MSCSGCKNILGSTVSRLFEVTDGNPWTPASVPASDTTIGVAFVVLSGMGTIIDAAGIQTDNIPPGVSGSWGALAESGELLPPAVISVTGGVILVTVEVVL